MDFSIVIPTRSRTQSLGRCCAALAQLDYDKGSFEVIVVDDGSPAPVTLPACPELNLRAIRQAHQGPAAARNAGAAAARGRYLVFTDDDCLPEPGWLRGLAKAFVRLPEAALGGATWNALPENPYAAASQALVDFLYDYCGTRDPDGAFFTSNNLAVPAHRFQQLGGFDPRFPRAAAEDRDFCSRWRELGLELRHVPEARVGHAHDLTLLTFVRQHFNYGRGAFHYHKYRAARARRGLRINSWRFYRALLSHPGSLSMSVLLLLSQATNALGFIYEAASRRLW